MRLTRGPMTPDEFAEALRLARGGEVTSDTGADDAIDAALLDVALDAPSPRAELIEAARDAFARRIQ